MPIQSFEEKTLTRLAALETKYNDLIVQDKPGSQRYTQGAIVFGAGTAPPTVDAANLFWDNTNKRLGIGTNAPAVTLDVRGAINTTDRVLVQAGVRQGLSVISGTHTARLRLFRAVDGARMDLTSNLWYDGSAWQRDNTSAPAGSIHINASGEFAYYYAAAGANPAGIAERFRVDTAGNVLIPNAFYPTGQSTYYMNLNAFGSGIYAHGHFIAGGAVFPNNQGSYSMSVAVGTPAFNFNTNLANTGYISTGSHLWVASNAVIGLGGIGSGEQIWSNRSGGNQYGLNFITQSAHRMTITSGGRVGIGMGDSGPAGTTLNIRAVDWSTTTNAINVQRQDAGVNFFGIRSDGGQNSTHIAWTITSAREAKDKIRNADRGLKELRKLRPRRYALRVMGDDAPDKFFGFVAEEMPPEFAELVETMHDPETGGEMHGIRYTDFIPIIIGGLQELTDRIEAIEGKKSK